jgi:cytochrome c
MKLTGNTFLITLSGSGIYPTAGSNNKPELRSHPQNHSRILKYASIAAFAFAIVAASESQAQEPDGERLFRQRCSSCHSLETGQNRTGPSLAAVNGRAAGSLEGARYSPALRDSTVVWNAETLDRFLASPRQFLPGTTMTMSVTNEAQRRAMVDFLTASR